ncbi:MAG: hypothetical protein OXC01_05200 [Immundisolibacterales bacterium]|nr:hypothetical protein [Immundisolibacterales bacterium]
MVNRRTIWAIAAFVINAILSYEWYRLPPEKLSEMAFNIVSRESLIFGGVVFATCLTIAFAWPWIRWVWAYPARRRAKQQAEEAARKKAAAEHKRAETARERAKIVQIGELFEELRRRIGLRNGRDRELMIPYDKQRGPYRPLRSLINWLGTSGGNYADAEAMTRVLAIFGELDALGLVPGGIPRGNPPENDGLDLDWHAELGRIRTYLLEEGIEATRAKIRDWYGHLNPAPRDGLAPAAFNYGGSIAEAIAGCGRAEHRRLPEVPEPPV